MERAIDASELMAEIQVCSWDSEQDRERAEDLVLGMPTLTPPNEWVSVEERLPEKKQDVLMLFKSGNMAVGWWHDVDEHVTFWCAYTDDGFYTDCDDMPVYWMHLPAPPDRRPPDRLQEHPALHPGGRPQRPPRRL